MKILTVFRFFLLGLVVAAPIMGAAAESDGAAPIDFKTLLVRMKAAMAANATLEQQYTSDEYWHNLNYNKKGKLTDEESARYENVFVEGLPYRRKVEENGKRLTGKAAEKEEARYEKAVRERRGLSVEQKRRLFHTFFHYSLPVCCLETMFENRIVGRELLNGRDTVVVESIPKEGVRPTNDSERSSLNWKETTWIDVADAIPARIEVVLLNSTGHMEKGATNRLDFSRIASSLNTPDEAGSGVWLQSHFLARFHFKIAWVSVTGTTEQTWSNFKRFRVDMRLLDDSVREVPPAK